jgi:hypothetical protein
MNLRRSGSTLRRSRRSGLTLVEITIGCVVLVTGVLSFAQAMISIEKAQQHTREVGRATQAARQVLEGIQAQAFAEAFRYYNGTTADDPGGVGTAPGKNFNVAGLTPRTDDPDGFVGEVVFPTPAGQPGVLRENTVDAKLGMPRDLNGDGLINNLADYSTTYTILPVRVRVEWVGAGGPGVVELRTLLGNF